MWIIYNCILNSSILKDNITWLPFFLRKLGFTRWIIFCVSAGHTTRSFWRASSLGSVFSSVLTYLQFKITIQTLLCIKFHASRPTPATLPCHPPPPHHHHTLGWLDLIRQFDHLSIQLISSHWCSFPSWDQESQEHNYIGTTMISLSVSLLFCHISTKVTEKVKILMLTIIKLYSPK